MLRVVVMTEISDYLEKIYFDTSRPAALSGPEKLYQIVKREGKYKISRNKIKQWLNDRDEYSAQRDIKRKFPRRKIITSGVNVQWGLDLCSTQNIASFNDGVKHLLFAVCVFSRYLHIQPLKSKRAKEVVEAFDRMLQDGSTPYTIYFDAGGEFNNANFRKYLQSKDIKYFTTRNQETKAAITERTIRTFRNKMFRMFRHTRSYRFIESLQNLVKSYNSTPHSGLPNHLAPEQVTKENEAEIWDKMYNGLEKQEEKHIKPLKKEKRIKSSNYKFKIGDIVRLSHARYAFQRDYQQKWTGELFKVSERYIKQDIQIYKVIDFLKEPVVGTFYSQEMLKITNKSGEDALWILEKIIKRRKRAGKLQYLVKFQDWPSKFNVWVNASSVVDIQK